MNKLKRIQSGRYEDGTYGIRKIEECSVPWQTFILADGGNLDGGWMQSYMTLRDAKAGLVAIHTETTTKGTK